MTDYIPSQREPKASESPADISREGGFATGDFSYDDAVKFVNMLLLEMITPFSILHVRKFPSIRPTLSKSSARHLARYLTKMADALLRGPSEIPIEDYRVDEERLCTCCEHPNEYYEALSKCPKGCMCHG